ncbi:macrophage mannose receptor 1-like [Patiria miniata]|uniref:C-type lectin domain-containing protein n=1 Tax=Patiria miniata TaxID=46514 RepID=A0A914B6G5_PATMI|nr:macrophage mannose receptor 1-like [Patiria miniata]
MINSLNTMALNEPKNIKPAILIVIIGCLGVSAVCKPGWKEHSSSCYKFTDIQKNWENANTYCQRLGGMLLVIESEEENEFIAEEMRNSGMSRAWLGCNDISMEGTWVCYPEGLKKMRYKNWDGGKPNNIEDQDCVVINKRQGKWNDRVCGSRNEMYTICESSISPVSALSCYVLGLDGRIWKDVQNHAVITTLKMGILLELLHLKTTLVVVFILFLCHAGVNAFCKPGWKEHCSSCYKFTDNHTDWENANTYCQGLGGMLLVIESEEENEFIAEEMRNSGMPRAWLGCNDASMEGTWVCYPEGFKRMQYTNWAEGQPDNNCGDQHCGIIRHGKWKDKRCINRYVYTVCETSSRVSAMSCYILGPDGRFDP